MNTSKDKKQKKKGSCQMPGLPMYAAEFLTCLPLDRWIVTETKAPKSKPHSQMVLLWTKET
jgi:hypothetical protein